jgi:bacteriocin-like protein
MDIMRELTDTELESVTGGLAAAAASAGDHSATALSTNTAGSLIVVGLGNGTLGESISTMSGVIGAQAAASAN